MLKSSLVQHGISTTFETGLRPSPAAGYLEVSQIGETKNKSLRVLATAQGTHYITLKVAWVSDKTMSEMFYKASQINNFQNKFKAELSHTIVVLFFASICFV